MLWESCSKFACIVKILLVCLLLNRICYQPKEKYSLQRYCGKVVPNLISSNFPITCPVKILLVWLVLSKFKKTNKLLKTSKNMHCRVSNESSRYSASNDYHNWEL